MLLKIKGGKKNKSGMGYISLKRVIALHKISYTWELPEENVI